MKKTMKISQRYQNGLHGWKTKCWEKEADLSTLIYRVNLISVKSSKRYKY